MNARSRPTSVLTLRSTQSPAMDIWRLKHVGSSSLSGCCACAMCGHATAPPRSVMNWRRRMRPSGKDHGLCQGLKASTFSAPMCALGHKRRFAMLKPMSGPEADISRRGAMSALPPKEHQQAYFYSRSSRSVSGQALCLLWRPWCRHLSVHRSPFSQTRSSNHGKRSQMRFGADRSYPHPAGSSSFILLVLQFVRGRLSDS